MRKEVIGPATLYLGDCREIMPKMVRGHGDTPRQAWADAAKRLDGDSSRNDMNGGE